MSYCAKYHVDLSHEKTKLQVYSPASLQKSVDYWATTAPLVIDDNFINFVDSAEHVGIVRSISGNQPHILNRISSHKKGLGASVTRGNNLWCLNPVLPTL